SVPGGPFQKCAKKCKGDKFFATQYGRQCWCGDSKTTDFDKHGKAECNQTCSGKDGEICGGKWAMSVYQAV
ncbi:unnamed protein product, partial [Laminaria digitata]